MYTSLDCLPGCARRVVADSVADAMIDVYGQLDGMNSRIDLEAFVADFLIGSANPNQFTLEETLEIVATCQTEIPCSVEDFGYGRIRQWLRMVSQETMEHAGRQVIVQVLEQLVDLLAAHNFDLEQVKTTAIDCFEYQLRRLSTRDLVIAEFFATECPPSMVVWRIRHELFQWTVLVPEWKGEDWSY